MIIRELALGRGEQQECVQLCQTPFGAWGLFFRSLCSLETEGEERFGPGMGVAKALLCLVYESQAALCALFQLTGCWVQKLLSIFSFKKKKGRGEGRCSSSVF